MTKKSVPRKHHYLPQFYLRRFSVSGDGLYQIGKSDGRIMPVKIKDVAAIRDFHVLDDDGTLDRHALETELAKVEGKMAPHLANLLGGGFNHLPTQLYVKQFLSMLRMRVPAIRDHIQTSMSDVVHEELKSMEERGRLPTPPEGMESVLRVENLHVEIKNRAIMEKMFRLGGNDDVLEIYYSMQPTLLHAPLGSWFITSDQPVALYHPQPYLTLGVGPEDPDVVISLPLSSRTALLLANNKRLMFDSCHPGIERIATADEVHEINRRTVMMAKDWIFTGESPASLSALIEGTRGHSCGLTYKKIQTKNGVGFLMQNIAVGPKLPI